MPLLWMHRSGPTASSTVHTRSWFCLVVLTGKASTVGVRNLVELFGNCLLRWSAVEVLDTAPTTTQTSS